jgi:hypothetical protein
MGDSSFAASRPAGAQAGLRRCAKAAGPGTPLPDPVFSSSIPKHESGAARSWNDSRNRPVMDCASRLDCRDRRWFGASGPFCDTQLTERRPLRCLVLNFYRTDPATCGWREISKWANYQRACQGPVALWSLTQKFQTGCWPMKDGWMWKVMDCNTKG